MREGLKSWSRSLRSPDQSLLLRHRVRYIRVASPSLVDLALLDSSSYLAFVELALREEGPCANTAEVPSDACKSEASMLRT